MFVPSKKSLSIALIACAALIPAAVFASTDFDRIVFFGDSLSDSGNAFVLTGEFSVRPFDPIPSAPYLIGGLHFTNGKTWAEQFAQRLRLRRSGKPAFWKPGVFTNYAVGGSRARAEGTIHLSTQVGLFSQDFPAAPSDALYAIVIGGNDLRDAIEAFAIDPTGDTSFEIIADAVGAIAANITALTAMGARDFLVGDSPDLGLAPAIRVLGEDAQILANQLTLAFNGALEGVLGQLEGGLPISIERLSLFALITDIVDAPDLYGFREVEEPCLTFDVFFGAICRRPGKYLFWDAIHPTRAAHRVLGLLALEAVD
jgi:phospholipase/lecithinase/hemolysin